MALATFALISSRAGGRWNMCLGDWGLLLLSLPLVSTLEFYLAFPLRLIVTTLACASLKLCGWAVSGQGTEILIGNHIIAVDAPCSGIKMLWYSMYLAATICSARQSDARSVCSYVFLAFASSLLGNVLRVTSLFFVETGATAVPVKLEPILHQLIGISIFAVVTMVVLYAGRFFDRPASPDTIRARRAAPTAENKGGNIWLDSWPLAWTMLAVICLWAFIQPFASVGAPEAIALQNFKGWPATFEGRQLVELPQTVEQTKFIANFPGRVAVFDDGGRRVIMRWLSRATRQMHPASDCYRGLGYQVSWLPLFIDQGGRHWSRFAARRGSVCLVVRECIIDERGRSWSDASSWYWAAALHGSSPPWWGFSVAERQTLAPR